MKAALRAAHGKEFVEQQLSMYYVTLEVAQVRAGMNIAIPEEHWTIFRRKRHPPNRRASLVIGTIREEVKHESDPIAQFSHSKKTN